ncbi:MAG: hypothetical protein ABIG61_17750, partial [Planctomycetota bacterium]
MTNGNGYKPYPIFDFKSGLVLAKQPWLLPADAFSSLIDCHIKRGVLEKRKGYTEYGQLVHTDTGTGVDAGSTDAIMGLPTHYYGTTATLLAFDTDRMNYYNTTTSAFVDKTRYILRIEPTGQTHKPAVDSVIYDAANHAIHGVVEAVYTITGTWTGSAYGYIILKNDGTLTGTFGSAKSIDNAGATEVYGKTAAAGEDTDFNGTSSDFFRLTNWENIGYITNGVDQLWKYRREDTGSTEYLLPYDVDLTSGGYHHNDVTAVKFVFVYKSRLVLLSLTESGTSYPCRARWCDINDPTTYTAANYVDCPTRDTIVTAGFIGEDLIVWFDKTVWKLVYTSDPDQPFRWEQVSAIEGASAPQALVNLGDRQVTLGIARILSCDGRDVTPIDAKIPEAMLGFNLSNIAYSSGVLVRAEEEAWFSYCSAGQDYPDQVLVWNYIENTFAIYNLDAHCFGLFSRTSGLNPDDMTGIYLDDLDYSLDDISLAAGYPELLMGSR